MAAFATTSTVISATRPVTGRSVPRVLISSRTTSGSASPVAAVARLSRPPTTNMLQCGRA